MFELTEKFNAVTNVLKKIPKGKKIIIIAHLDTDGITSAFVFSRILERLGFEYNKEFRTWFVESAFREKLKTNNDCVNNIMRNEYIFFLDFAPASYDLFKDKTVCTIDHHKITGEHTLFEINPSGTEKTLPSASALVYALYKQMFGDNPVIKKIAFLGALGDLMIYDSLPYLETTTQDSDFFINNLVQGIYYNMLDIFKIMSEDVKHATTIYEYMLSSLTDSIEPVIILPDDWTKIIANNYKGENKALKMILRKIEVIKEKDLVWLETDSKINPYFTNIKTTLNALYPHETLIILKKLPNKIGYNVSCRSQKKIDLVKLIDFLKTQVQDLQGGGHPFAAGFYFKPKYKQKVRKLVLENIEKFSR